ncbi:MAG: fadE 2 [Gammaproteobacteria bacterium]|jgi:acyl-CoA dehydrogenase|nr:fadE 2 [Gammaproteobacteria bacterium]
MEYFWIIAFVGIISMLAYQRASLAVWTCALLLFLGLITILSRLSPWILSLGWFIFFIGMLPLYATSLRQKWMTQRLLNFYCNHMPTMSSTEREALAAGTIGWEGDLFRGTPNWEKLLTYPKATLSAEEKAFLAGPVQALCAMIDDWEITHHLADLPPKMWQFLKEEGFFALIIPKKYGGKAFSAYAHSQILTTVYGKSASVASTIAVPNSLGPAELLLHYGTEEQKNYYLPRLARGEEVPCFALTGLEAGSDAGAMTDKGTVCWGEYEGKKIIGIELSWNKRYITLAPVATVIGLAFKLYDPEHLLGKQKKLGITCALIPRNTPGIVIGRRHFPCNAVFQNGPTQGDNVFIPLDWVIGGPAMVGQGWRMLMECLAAGRAISLPASGTGGAKMAIFASSAYAHIRRQFKLPIGRFEGIEAVLARMAGYTYLMDATRTFTAAMIDSGEKPALASAITKYHVTELGRKVIDDAMDIHGGKGICLGPRNYLGRFYQAIPIAITVEGANILTRSMIIFGQGAMRCHPYILAELKAASCADEKQRLCEFDKALMGHISFSLSHFFRTAILGLTSAKIVKAPVGETKRYFQQATRFSAAFAMLADMSLLVLKGALKRKESISARLGDILSYLYLLSAVLKHHYDQGSPIEDLPLVKWASLTCLFEIQESIDGLLTNFPHRGLAYFLRLLIFPIGMRFARPDDKLSFKVAQSLLIPTPTRTRLTEGVFNAPVPNNMLGMLEDALQKVILAEPIEKIIKTAFYDKLIKGEDFIQQGKAAVEKKIISNEQLTILLAAEEARRKVISVDDFAPEELSS